MAPAPTTSAFIPPPPLPEYYQKSKVTITKQAQEEGATSTSPAKPDVQALVVRTKTTTKEKPSKQDITYTHAEAQIGIPIIGDATDERMLTKHMATYDVPPLAVYHICRICLRPRSNRYHREHPIPVNGVPPPPGICRRCRVKQIEEQEVVEKDVIEVVKLRDERPGCPNLFQRGESNDIRLGLSALIPGEDVVSAEQAAARRDREVLRKLERSERLRREREVLEESSESEEEVRRITYRHVRVRERSVSSTPQAAVADVDEAPLPKPRTSAKSTAQDAIDAVSLLSQEPVMTTATVAAASMEVHAGPTQPALTATQAHSSSESEAVEIVKVDLFKETSAKGSALTSYSPSKLETKASVQVVGSTRPSFTETDIRRLAREEVIKYRQAERKLENHPDPYAHGRLVPVKRRIEKSRDVREPRPWEEVEVRVVTKPDGGKKSTSQATHAGSSEGAIIYEHISSRSQPPNAEDRSVKAKTPELQPVPKSTAQSQRVHTSERDFAYEASTNTRTVTKKSDQQGEDAANASTKPASQRGPSVKYSQAGWRGATGEIEDQHEMVVEHERYRRPESRSTHKSAQTLQEAKLSSRAPRSTTTEQRSDRFEARKRAEIASSSRKPLPPESDPPVSVKLREVLSWDPAQRFEARDAWQEPPSQFNVIEVVEAVDQPRPSRSRTDSRVSERVQELKDEADREEQAVSVRSSTGSTSGYLYAEGSARTASNRCSEARKAEVEVETRGGAEGASERSARSQQSQKPPDSRNEPGLPDDKTMWPGSGSSRSGMSRDTGHEDGAQNTKRDHRSSASSRRTAAVLDPESSTRPGAQQRRDAQPLRDDEYIWVRRVTRPLNSDEERVSYDELPAKYRNNVDSFFRQSFDPVGAGPKDNDGRPSYHWIEAEERLESKKPNEKPTRQKQERETAVRTDIEDVRSGRRASPPAVRPSRKQQQRRHYRRETKGSPSSTSTRVRFASKVEISPTPPGSDASSTQFRIIGGNGRSKKRTDGESGEDLIAEYEERGRTHVRRDRRHQEPIEEEGPEYYYEKKKTSTASNQAQEGDGDNQWDGADESQYRPRKSRPLHKALSESPSRERLSETFSGSAKKIELAGAYKHKESWRETVETVEREGDGKW